MALQQLSFDETCGEPVFNVGDLPVSKPARKNS